MPISEHFDEVVQKAHRSRVLIVSPSLLMMAIQVMQAIVRDARGCEQAHIIQDEVRKLVDDVRRLRDRTAKLDQHFRQAQDDVTQIVTSTDKIVKRGDRIDQMDFADPAAILPAQRDCARRRADSGGIGFCRPRRSQADPRSTPSGSRLSASLRPGIARALPRQPALFQDESLDLLGALARLHVGYDEGTVAALNLASRAMTSSEGRHAALDRSC